MGTQSAHSTTFNNVQPQVVAATPSTRYFHCRRMELVARMGTLEARPASTGGLTFAYRIINDTLRFSVARCSLRDHYSKRIGRQQADMHSTEGYWEELPLAPGDDPYAVIWQHVNSNKLLRKSLRCTLVHAS